jgi:hypothetical protein
MLRVINKEVVASHNLKFSLHNDKEINRITNKIVSYYIKQKKEQESYYTYIKFDYSDKKKKIEPIRYIIVPDKTEDGRIGAYYPLDQVLVFYPNNITISTDNKRALFNIFKPTVQHEISHIVDPKSNFIDPDAKPRELTPLEYYSSPMEFDAYSKQIIERLRSQITIDPSVKNMVLKWLKDSSAYCGYLIPYSEVFENWIESDSINKTDYMRRFKNRIYNELFAGEE